MAAILLIVASILVGALVVIGAERNISAPSRYSRREGRRRKRRVVHDYGYDDEYYDRYDDEYYDDEYYDRYDGDYDDEDEWPHRYRNSSLEWLIYIPAVLFILWLLFENIL